MRSSKWLVFIRPALAGFDRPLTIKVGFSLFSDGKETPPTCMGIDFDGDLSVRMLM
jgi:hypothetical protein